MKLSFTPYGPNHSRTKLNPYQLRADRCISKVRVFKDDPVWPTLSRWFYMSAEDKKRLVVCTYNLSLDEDGDPFNLIGELTWIYDQHPGCVFVY